MLEVDDPEWLSAAALARIDADESMSRAERVRAGAAVREDEAEALAYLVEPADLVEEVLGVELAQASWTSELIDYDPEAVEWDLDEEDDGEDGDDDGDDDRDDYRDDDEGAYDAGYEGRDDGEGKDGGKDAAPGTPASGEVGGVAERVGGGRGRGR